MKLTFAHSLSLFSILALAIACGKTKTTPSGTSSATDPFLSLSDLSKGINVKTIAKADLSGEINGISGFYDDDPTGAALALTADCVTTLLNNMPVKSFDTYLAIGGELDITSCLPELFSNQDIKGKSSTMRIAIQIGCDKQDFSSYEGMTFGNVEKDVTLCQNATTNLELFNLKLSIAATVTKSGQTLDMQLLSYTGTAMKNMQPCLHKVTDDVVHLGDGCLKTQRDVNAIYRVNGAPTSEEGAEDFNQLETVGIVSAAGTNDWFQSGSMKTTVNNWMGTATYSGTTTPPNYSLTNGSETAAGSLSVSRSIKKQSVEKIGETTAGQMLKVVATVSSAARSL